jgi:hypothetical protein
MDDNATNTIVCPKCNTSNPAGHLYCQSCGTPLKTPPAQPAYISPPPGMPVAYPPAPAGKMSYYGTVKIDNLGQRLDGWADLVDGAGDKAAAVENAFVQELGSRQFPHLALTRADLTPGGLAGKQRGYLLAQAPAGATLAVYIGQYGKDLYLTWDLFLRTVIQWRNILIMLAIAAVLALIPELDRFSLFRWILGFFGACIPVGLAALLLGKALRNSALAFFIQEIDMFVADDITAAMFAAHHALLLAVDEAGLNADLLRKKESFRAGRRERVI